MLAPDGVINYLLVQIGLFRSPYSFWENQILLVDCSIRRFMEGIRLNTIIYLAAIADVNPALYEAAEIDGAGRFKKCGTLLFLHNACGYGDPYPVYRKYS